MVSSMYLLLFEQQNHVFLETRGRYFWYFFKIDIGNAVAYRNFKIGLYDFCVIYRFNGYLEVGFASKFC